VQEVRKMAWRGTAVAKLNRLLKKAGVVLSREHSDFEDQLISTKHLDLMFAALADELDEWLQSQTIFAVVEKFDVFGEVAKFYSAYLGAPYRDQSAGSRFNNLLWLALIAKALQPTLIVDSGTYSGASAWALAFGAPTVPVLSFDINMSQLRHRAKNVEYVEEDWAQYDLAGFDLGRGFCYFDDHVDQAKRLMEAASRGFPIAVFDDDLSIGAFPQMARDTSVLPKIEFILDEGLQDGEELRWLSRGVSKSWIVDKAYLDMARSLIKQADRLPNTSLTTGIHQTPYRIVSLIT
jgi:hypothetical protein